nr:DegT/DnrJ/EryC1/StrS family aminotransferase [Lachnospiraceae bacterium]
GYNSRLDALQAAVLSVKLRHLDAYNAARAAVAKRYYSELTKDLILPSHSEDITPCWHQFVVRSEKKKELCSYLTTQGVGCGTFYPVPLHRQKAFHEGNCSNAGAYLPVAEMISSQSVYLPIWPELTKEQVDTVIGTVNGFYFGRVA